MRVNIRANFRIDWTFRGKDLKEGGGGSPPSHWTCSQKAVRIQLNKSCTAKLQVKTIDQGITLLEWLSVVTHTGQIIYWPQVFCFIFLRNVGKYHEVIIVHQRDFLISSIKKRSSAMQARSDKWQDWWGHRVSQFEKQLELVFQSTLKIFDPKLVEISPSPACIPRKG